MEEEKASDKLTQPSPPSPAGLPINWGLITGPVQPVVSGTSFVARLPQTSAAHTLQTKVRSTAQRRTRGRDRDRDRERPEPEALLGGQSAPEGQKVRQWAGGKCRASAGASSWRSGAAKTSSTSDEEEEVEVEVKLEIHSPPAGVKGEQVLRLGEEADARPKEGPTDGLPDDTCQGNPPSPSAFRNKVPPPLPVLSTPPVTTPAASSTSSSASARHWAPPKGFWKVARPETLLLNGVGPSSFTSNLPLRDYTQSDVPPEPSSRGAAAPTADGADAPSEVKEPEAAEGCEQEEADNRGACSPDSGEGEASQSAAPSADERLKVKQRAYAKLRERQQKCREGREQGGRERSNSEDVAQEGRGVQELSSSADSTILAQDLEPYLRSLLVISDDLPLSPRHEQAKLLLERARLKARSNHIKGERPGRRAHSDQRPTVRKQQVESLHAAPVQKAIQTEDPPAPNAAGPLLVPNQTDTSPVEQGRRYGCSPTRVRFEDESEKEAESRYLDRVRQRGRPENAKSKSKESNMDSSTSGSERGRSHRSVSMPPPQKPEDVGVSEVTTVVKEIIVLVKKCEACGSVVRELQPLPSPSDLQNTEQQNVGNAEDPRGKAVPHWVPPNKPETSTRPKAPLTVTFAGAYVLGENKEGGTGWKSSGFGKLRRRSRKGENRLESGHGPYGPSWAQRRNSNPRNRANLSRAVSFAPGSPITLEPPLLEASGGARDSTAPPLPIKSALKSSSRNRSAASQSTVQFQVASSQGEGVSQHSILIDSPEARRESPAGLTPGATPTSNPVPCIRPSTLRYSPARLTADAPTAEPWDATPDGTAGLTGELGAGPDCRPALRGLALSRAEDLRAELLRAEHLKAEALWEENSDGSRKLDGRPKLFLRRFFSSIGLNSVGRLVKGGRSSSMEQLSIPAATRASSASPSPTRRPQPASRIQRTPSLQTLHTVLPLAQLRKASSVQSLERRTERTTILGEVQIPYGLAPRYRSKTALIVPSWNFNRP
ncbi:uncharacterized protein isoform X3 [Takifugu rubripes]|uniref:uncharacterized protein isoform X3 n=1 Tax=Takifugu rubripes TaxID=31033 RepID=UPI001145B1AE|nr:uncharacterized protein LOC115247855 isoform X3 [Takifugu rubripes]